MIHKNNFEIMALIVGLECPLIYETMAKNCLGKQLFELPNFQLKKKAPELLNVCETSAKYCFEKEKREFAYCSYEAR